MTKRMRMMKGMAKMKKIPEGWKKVETGVAKDGDKIWDAIEECWNDILDAESTIVCSSYFVIRKDVKKIYNPWKIVTISIT
jgi:hypothetical protein